MIIETLDDAIAYTGFATTFGDELILLANRAEKKFLVPVFGTELLAELAAPSTDIATEINEHLKEACGAFAAITYSRENVLTMTESGPMVGKTPDMEMASQWRIDDYRRAQQQRAEESVLAAINLLNANLADFDTWTDGKFKEYRANLIASSGEFNQVCDFAISMITFRKMLPDIRRAERSEIATTLGPGLYTAVKAAMLEPHDEDTPNPYDDIIPLIQEVIAYHSLGLAVASLIVNISDVGITQFENNTGTGTINRQYAASSPSITTMRQLCREKAKNSLGSLQKLLDAKAAADDEDYADYKTEKYNPAQSDTIINQEPGNGFIAM